MKPSYDIRAWQQDGWWLARVVGASDGADATPVNALTHARTLTRIEQVARDLVATILDAREESFDIELEYLLQPELDALVCAAIGAQTWLDAARDLSYECSAAAVAALTEQGFSPADTAKLLGLGGDDLARLLAEIDPGHCPA